MFLQPAVDHAAGATRAYINCYGLCRAVALTGAAFHAAVQVNDGSLALFN